MGCITEEATLEGDRHHDQADTAPRGAGAEGERLFSIMVMVVVATTLAAPIWLRHLLGDRRRSADR